MKSIQDIEFRNKRIILRLDYNVSIKDGKIMDNTKIKASIPTIEYLLNKGNHILIMSHLGRVKTEEDKKNNSLKLISNELSTILNRKVVFVDKTRGIELEEAITNNELTLMENTRFEDVEDKKESNCNIELAKYWASLGEVFINDAFATTHRKHASNYGISKYLDTYYGFLIEKEIIGLDPVVNVTKRPFSVIMGGAKVDDKIQLIESMLVECDCLLVGGGIANTFLKANGNNIGNSLYSEEYVENIRHIIDRYNKKILIPLDVIVKRHDQNIMISIDEIEDNDCIYDIGNKTVELYKEKLLESKLIFMNGTVGLYEEKEYKNGTESMFKILSNSDSIKIVGGGDALASMNKLGYKKSITYASTGGGATLEYISKKKLECFEE